MSAYSVFPNAPIVEAVLDIRAELPPEIDLKTIEKYHDSIKERFPEKKERFFFEGAFKVSPKATPEFGKTSSKIDGYLFKSFLEKKVVQSRLDGFTFSKLKPYDRWESFLSEGKKLWSSYLEIAKPIKITRIALRYINRIELPLPVVDLSEYVLTRLEIPSDLPQEVAHFFIRIMLSNPAIESSAIILQTIEDPTPNKKVPLILDIDVFREASYSPGDMTIWDDFDKLREFKNEIFFKSITEKTKEFFK